MSYSNISTVKKAHILNEGERTCFEVLSHSIDHSMIVLPKVQIEDIFNKNNEGEEEEFWTHFKRIASRHVDFLVCNRKDFKPLLCIQIQGDGHQGDISEEDRQFMMSIFLHSEIPVLDISLEEISEYKRAFEEATMNVRIKEALHLD